MKRIDVFLLVTLLGSLLFTQLLFQALFTDREIDELSQWFNRNMHQDNVDAAANEMDAITFVTLWSDEHDPSMTIKSIQRFYPESTVLVGDAREERIELGREERELEEKREGSMVITPLRHIARRYGLVKNIPGCSAMQWPLLVRHAFVTLNAQRVLFVHPSIIVTRRLDLLEDMWWKQRGYLMIASTLNGKACASVVQGYIRDSKAYREVAMAQFGSLLADPMAFCSDESRDYFVHHTTGNPELQDMMNTQDMHFLDRSRSGNFATHSVEISSLPRASDSLVRMLHSRSIVRSSQWHSRNEVPWKDFRLVYSMQQKIQQFGHSRIKIELCVFFGPQLSNPDSLLEFLKSLTRTMKMDGSRHLIQMHLVVAKRNTKKIKSILSKVEMQIMAYPLVINIIEVTREAQQNNMPFVHMLQSFFSMVPSTDGLTRSDIICFSAYNNLIRAPYWMQLLSQYLSDNTPQSTKVVSSVAQGKHLNVTDIGMTCVHSSHAKIFGDATFFPPAFLVLGDGTHHLQWLIGAYELLGRTYHFHKDLMVDHSGTKKTLDMYRSTSGGELVKGDAFEAETALLESQIKSSSEKIQRTALSLPNRGS